MVSLSNLRYIHPLTSSPSWQFQLGRLKMLKGKGKVPPLVKSSFSRYRRSGRGR